MNCSITNRQCGFTLLEVLVAFVVLALVGGMLLQLFQGGLRNIDSGRHITHASLLAKTKLAELQAITNIQSGAFQGRFDETYSWRLNLEPENQDSDFSPPPGGLIGLNATLDVYWEPGGLYRVKTLLLSQAGDS